MYTTMKGIVVIKNLKSEYDSRKIIRNLSRLVHICNRY